MLAPKVGVIVRLVLTAATFLGLAATSANAAIWYRVRPGDTLTEIARVEGTSVVVLERLNGLAPDGVLFAGSTLRLPAAKPRLRPYRVQPGDTLTGLAERFHTTVTAIADASHLKIAQFLLAGATVEIPGGNAGTSDSPSVRESILRWSNHYGVDPHLATALACGWNPGSTTSSSLRREPSG